MFARLQEAFIVGLLIAAIQLTAAPALAAPPGMTKGEFKCENGVATKFATLIWRKGVCVQRCIREKRVTSGPYTDCFAPYGGDTQSCISDPVLGVEARTRLAIASKCSVDCPECYQVTLDCADGEPSVSQVSGVLDTLGVLIYCSEFSGNTPSKEEAKCENVVAKVTAKMIEARIECFETCFAKVFADQLTLADCTPGNTLDPALVSCLQRIEGKAIFKIDVACAAAGGIPACHGGFNSGAAWVGLTGGYIDGQVQYVACGD
jgi:hypothetical protein